jgi:hypothetical protein
VWRSRQLAVGDLPSLVRLDIVAVTLWAFHSSRYEPRDELMKKERRLESGIATGRLFVGTGFGCIVIKDDANAPTFEA